MSMRALSGGLATVCWGLWLVGAVVSAGEPIVIAHRGASGYLPEHTLAAKAMAHAMGADYIEQDVVLTKDGHPVVLHDVHLDNVTDVARVFPERARDDGRYYAIDFTLDEIRQLQATERFDRTNGAAVLPRRFPTGHSRFAVPTLAEEIELIQGLNKSTGKHVGVYPELKGPAWHREQGQDLSAAVLKVLDQYGYRDRADNVYVQCFDPDETRRLREQLGTKLKLVQLLGRVDWQDEEGRFDRRLATERLKQIAGYADGIGPSMRHVVDADEDGSWKLTPLVELAHAAGLAVHPYTLQADVLPEYASDFDQLLGIFYREAAVDGAFTDFPDRAAEFLRRGDSEAPAK